MKYEKLYFVVLPYFTYKKRYVVLHERFLNKISYEKKVFIGYDHKKY